MLVHDRLFLQRDDGFGRWRTVNISANRPAKWQGVKQLGIGGHARKRTGVYGFAVQLLCNQFNCLAVKRR
jgi:hypothetical protein